MVGLRERIRRTIKERYEERREDTITFSEIFERATDPLYQQAVDKGDIDGETVVREHLEDLRDKGEIDYSETDGEYRILSTRPFQMGESYRRKAIHDKYGGIRYSGIAPCADYPYVFLFTGEVGKKYGYKDEFRPDGSFIYTGEGPEGDMEFKAGNKAIRDHNEDGRELHLFEIGDGGYVTYLGQYECVDWFREQLPDKKGDLRSAIRFKLEPVGGITTALENHPEELSEDELYELAKEATERAAATTTSQTSYNRSEVVRQFALREADGECGGCGDPAPFVDEDGEPFLEVHHLYRRSDGGLDDPDNVIALCPNCHRRVHYGNDGAEFNEELIEKVRQKRGLPKERV